MATKYANTYPTYVAGVKDQPQESPTVSTPNGTKGMSENQIKRDALIKAAAHLGRILGYKGEFNRIELEKDQFDKAIDLLKKLDEGASIFGISPKQIRTVCYS